MQKYINMKKVEKKQWFIIGLQIIENEGVSKITIDNLCLCYISLYYIVSIAPRPNTTLAFIFGRSRHLS